MVQKWSALLLAGAVCVAGSAHALTLKSGEVLGSDGAVYEGASPSQMENIKKRAIESGKNAGVTGDNVFVVTGEQVVFIPVSELAGKSDEQMEELVGTRVIQSVTGLPITFSEFNAVQAIASETGRGLGEVLGEQIDAGALSFLSRNLDELDADVAAGAKLIEESGIKDQIANSGLFDPAALDSLDEQLSDLTLEDARGVIEEVNRVQDEFAAAVAAQREADPDFFETAEGQALLEEAGLE